MEEGCEIEISGGRERESERERDREWKTGGGGGEEGWRRISGCSDKAVSSGMSWEFCVSDVCVFCLLCCVLLACGLLLKRRPTMDEACPLRAFVLYGD